MTASTPSLPNPFIGELKEDVLFHLGPTTADHDVIEKFTEVKFVIMGGTHSRMQVYAEKLGAMLGIKVEDFTNGDRYALFKVGPIVTVSHGVGTASASVVLHEIIKLLYHAKSSGVTLIRCGTSGGIGVEPGTVVVTRNAVNDRFEPIYEFSRLGKTIRRSSKLNQDLADSIVASQKNDDIPIMAGDTMCAEDFYECQGRLDGAVCEITKEEKMEFLKKASEAGVCNIEMESSCVASLCNLCGINAAVVCVTLIDRLKGDQVTTPRDVLHQWEERPMLVLMNFIKKRLNGSR